MSAPALDPQLSRFTGYLLRRAFVRSAGVARACMPDDAHVREIAVLAILAERGSSSQRELADVTHVNRTLVVKLVDGLEAKGWVVRERNANDRRSYALVLTPPGRQALAELSLDLDKGEAQLTQGLTTAETEQLRGWLSTLLADDPAIELSSLSRRTGYLIAHAHRRLRTLAEERLEPLGLHPRDFGVLSVLESDAPCSQNHLASRLAVTPPAALTFVEALETRGLVARRRRDDDRRVYDLTLTDAGTAILRRAQETAVTLQQEVADRLGPEADRELRRVLAKLLAETSPPAQDSPSG
jgi:DNA-binding MarR family transcriptional regulator